MNVAKFSEEFWKAVKCQSDLVLAGFLRNICKYDIYTKFMEVQHGNSQQILDYKIFEEFRLRGFKKSYQWKRNSEVHKLLIDIQTTHAKLGSQDGNSREHEIKVPNDY